MSPVLITPSTRPPTAPMPSARQATHVTNHESLFRCLPRSRRDQGESPPAWGSVEETKPVVGAVTEIGAGGRKHEGRPRHCLHVSALAVDEHRRAEARVGDRDVKPIGWTRISGSVRPGADGRRTRPPSSGSPVRGSGRSCDQLPPNHASHADLRYRRRSPSKSRHHRLLEVRPQVLVFLHEVAELDPHQNGRAPRLHIASSRQIGCRAVG